MMLKDIPIQTDTKLNTASDLVKTKDIKADIIKTCKELKKQMDKEYEPIAGKAITDPFTIEPSHKIIRLAGRYEALMEWAGIKEEDLCQR